MKLLADLVAIIHFGFILFVMFGGLLVLRWVKLAWAHVPCVLWGALLECFGWLCPLTPLEQWLRAASDSPAYEGGFVEHYLWTLMYPAGLNRQHQIWLGIALLLANGLIYLILWHGHRFHRRGGG